MMMVVFDGKFNGLFNRLFKLSSLSMNGNQHLNNLKISSLTSIKKRNHRTRKRRDWRSMIEENSNNLRIRIETSDRCDVSTFFVSHRQSFFLLGKDSNDLNVIVNASNHQRSESILVLRSKPEIPLCSILFDLFAFVEKQSDDIHIAVLTGNHEWSSSLFVAHQ